MAKTKLSPELGTVSREKSKHVSAKELEAQIVEDEKRRSENIDPPLFQTFAPRVFKVIVIGDTNVGKTSLTCRACDGKFPENISATIGVDFREKEFTVQKETVKLQFWDSAGQERFRQSMVPHYYRNLHAAVFVYDVTRRSSFDALQRWVDEFNCHVDIDRKVPIVLVGNKCDLHAERQVRSSEAKAYALNLGVPLWETSARSDLEADTLDAIFQALAETLKLKIPLLEFPPHYSSTIKLHNRHGLNVSQSVSASSESHTNSSRSQQSIYYNGSKTKRNSASKSCCGSG